MITIKFGLPGSGKTTCACRDALQGLKKYKNVYVNFPCSVPDVTVITNDIIGHYQLEDGLLIIDEGTIFADSRDHKNFSKSLVQFMCLHRHYRLDIIFYIQKWDAIDIKIRTLCDHVIYIRKSFLPFLSYEYLIPYGIEFSNPKHDGHRYGEIIMGYAKPNLFGRIFKTVVFRPLYYKYFDSWIAPELMPLPNSVVKNPHRLSFLEKIRERFKK